MGKMDGLDVLRDAMVSPHPASERFDSEYMVAMRCCRCGKVGYGPRAQLSQAVEDHMMSPSCRSLGDKAGDRMMRLFYPRV